MFLVHLKRKIKEAANKLNKSTSNQSKQPKPTICTRIPTPIKFKQGGTYKLKISSISDQDYEACSFLQVSFFHIFCNFQFGFAKLLYILQLSQHQAQQDHLLIYTTSYFPSRKHGQDKNLDMFMSGTYQTQMLQGQDQMHVLKNKRIKLCSLRSGDQLQVVQ